MRLRDRQRGFTLVEVLITLVVVGLALLSVAAMQIISRKAIAEAVQRGQATTLAQDLLQRIRANSSNLSAYLTPTTGLKETDTPGSQVCSDTAPCTTAQQATDDLFRWWENLVGASETVATANVGGLQNPTGCVTRVGGVGSCVVNVVIAWRGLTPQAPDPAIACGSTRAEYAVPENLGTNLSYRRTMVLTVNVSGGTTC